MRRTSKDTSAFLRLMEEQNARIAAREAEKKATETLGEDPIRLAREQERREKYGELRAREHPGKRHTQVRSVFGYVNFRQ